MARPATLALALALALVGVAGSAVAPCDPDGSGSGCMDRAVDEAPPAARPAGEAGAEATYFVVATACARSTASSVAITDPTGGTRRQACDTVEVVEHVACHEVWVIVCHDNPGAPHPVEDMVCSSSSAGSVVCRFVVIGSPDLPPIIIIVPHPGGLPDPEEAFDEVEEVVCPSPAGDVVCGDVAGPGPIVLPDPPLVKPLPSPPVLPVTGNPNPWTDLASQVVLQWSCDPWETHSVVLSLGIAVITVGLADPPHC